MAYIRCGTKKVITQVHDLYNIWQPYGNGNWTAPRDGTIKVFVFGVGYNTNINYISASASFAGVTASYNSYNSNSSNYYSQNFGMNNSGTAKVKKGSTYSVSIAESGTHIMYRGAVFTYID